MIYIYNIKQNKNYKPHKKSHFQALNISVKKQEKRET